MKWSLSPQIRLAFAATGLLLVGVGASGCTTTDTKVEARAVDTVPITPVRPGTTVPATPEPAATEPASSAAETTAPETTAPETTTPETTVPETTTTVPVPPLPSNIEVVGALDGTVDAVGNSGGAATKVVQLRLLQLGFWNSGPTGKYDLTTQQAVMAFQKYLNLRATGRVDADTAAYLQALDTKAHGQSNTGTLVEVDKGKQLLYFIVDGKTQWVLNTSTATGQPYSVPDQNTPGLIQTGVSITPDGLWKTYLERTDGWWVGDLGKIYRPKYFKGGAAVHGSNSIPNYPASHGCVRVSVPAMDWIWATNMMPLGITVWVHE